MPEDQCKQLEKEMNDNKEDNYMWIIDKPHSVAEVYNYKRCKHIVSAIGMPDSEIEKLQKELNEDSDKRFWVLDKPVTINTMYEDY
jgi:hypothetical protein